MSDTGAGWGGTDEPSAEVFGKPAARATPEFTDNEVLRAIGKELRAIKAWAMVGALAALFLAVIVALWVFGIVEVKLEPQSRF